jgi:hypothetical protein
VESWFEDVLGGEDAAGKAHVVYGNESGSIASRIDIFPRIVVVASCKLRGGGRV